MPETSGSADVDYSASKSLLKAGDLHAALTHLAAMIAAWPRDHRFYGLLAFVHDRQGNTPAALDALISALELDDGVQAHWQGLWSCMRRAAVAPDRRRLFAILGRALRLEGMDHADAEKEAQFQALAILRKCGSAVNMMRWAVAADGRAGADADGERDFLLTFLEYAPTTDRALEGLLTQLRRELLGYASSAATNARSPTMIELSSALALHFFHHEYVFSESEEEVAAVAALAQSLGSPKPDPVHVAVVAAYRPLHDQAWAPRLPQLFASTPSARFARLLKEQVTDWAEERALRGAIPRLTTIDNGVSQAVMDQYEENPYPRWHYLPTARAESARPDRRRRALIAGCGTGRQAANFAQACPGDEVWAMDLSLSSLTYAIRMAKAYGFANIRFFQGDILQLGTVDAQFEQVVCDGVLHHLSDPERGLQLLCDKLAPSGRLHLSVYAASGRVAITAAIALRERLGLPPTLAGIRKIREAICALPDADAAMIAGYRDFYFASECRDLLFHVQERTYTLNQLDDLFGRTRLKVVRLALPQNGVALYRAAGQRGEPDTDLAGWAEVEKHQTNLFGPMYSCALARVDDDG